MNVPIPDHELFKCSGILIVDDEPTVLEFFKVICQRAQFRSIFTANNGIEALATLKRHSNEIDLLSLDIVMPDMTGIQVAEIVANTHERIVGLVMLTGYGNPRVRDAFAALGPELARPERFLDKPVTVEKLCEVYANTLRDVFSKREKQPHFEVADLIIKLQSATAANSIELAKINSNLRQLDYKLDKLTKDATETKDRIIERQTTGDLSYAWSLAFIFLLVGAGFAWASGRFNIPLLSLVTLGSFALLVLILIAVFDLSKGGRLSEKSLMEVLRRTFQQLRIRKK